MAKGTRAKKTELHWTEEIAQIDGVHIHDNHHLYMHTPLRVGGPVESWVRCASVSALRTVMPIVRKQSWKLHWPFEDWLVKDGGLNGIVLRLEGEFEHIRSIEHGIELGTAALWSNLVGVENAPIELQQWSGSVGASLLSKNAAKLFTGFEIEVEWLRGRHKHRRFFDHQTPLEIPENAIPLFVRIFNVRRPRKLKPTRTGHVFSLDKSYPVGQTLSDLNLHAVRLRSWKISEHNPDIIVHLGKGDLQDLLLLQKALNQRLQPARNTKLTLRIPVLGRKS
jgi:UDP-N-acetylenolpyruvoylglucosamine reductase